MQSLLTVYSLVLAAVVEPVAADTHQHALPHANHIFNAIHSSMRQFGSSLNHNGMSIFIATVPADTEFYHGTNSHDRVNGTEWLAFEPEHALMFARSRRGPPGGGRGPPEDGPSKPGSWRDHYRGRRPSDSWDGKDAPFEPPRPRPGHRDQKQDLRRHERSQHSLDLVVGSKPDLTSDDGGSRGYLHTYRTKHALRLLYVDGQSAAKSDKGTLDLQDMVLLHHNPPSAAMKDEDENSPGRPHHGPMGEAERAAGLCRLAEQDYEGRIDGVLRMEGGFEIILCDFAKHLDFVSIAQAKSDSGMGPGRDNSDAFSLYQAVAARYDGIGGGRVTLDYSRFVTLYAFKEAVYFDEHSLPRVNNKTSVIEPVEAAVQAMVSGQQSTMPSVDWQATTDMVVARYSDRIALLADPSRFDDVKSFKAEAERDLRPFIDYGDRNRTMEAARCASHFLPDAPEGDNSTAYWAVLNVTTILCRTLVAASDVDTLPHGLSMIRALKSWLGWTSWKRCRGCGPDEVCFLPIWPQGSQADFDQPQCRSDISQAPSGYWGGFGRPPRDGKDGPGPRHRG